MNRILPTLRNDSLLRPFLGELFADLDDSMRSSASWAGNSSGFRMDVAEFPDSYAVKADLPGLSKEEIEITLHNGRLSIQVRPQKQVQDANDKQTNYILRERLIGAMTRTIVLPRVTSEEKVNASMKDGVLTVTVRKDEALSPKKIEIT